jgi:hypothetical protein
MAARMAMMAMTTSNSIKVNPESIMGKTFLRKNRLVIFMVLELGKT